MNKVIWLLPMLVGLACISYSSQYVSEPMCFGQTCPLATTSCKEHKQSSQDKRRIEIKISCLDEADASVKDYYFEEASHVDPHTTYKNTRYESINQGVQYAADPYRAQTLDLTPHYQRPGFY